MICSVCESIEDGLAASIRASDLGKIYNSGARRGRRFKTAEMVQHDPCRHKIKMKARKWL